MVSITAGTIADGSPVIGIDFGTTHCSVGVYKDHKFQIVPDDNGNRVTPSYVAWTGESDRLIGKAARDQAIFNPESTVFGVRRLYESFNGKTPEKTNTNLPFKIIFNDSKPYAEVEIDNKKRLFPPEDISALVLMQMKDQAETFLGEAVRRAVLTVPAYFSNEQREITKRAANLAGLSVERVINEPTAALIALDGDKYDKFGPEQTVLVYDLGGSTLDITVVNIDYGVFEVLATHGDDHLGGDDFNQRVMDYYIESLKTRDSLDISKNRRALQKLSNEVENAKRALSVQVSARLEVENIVDGVDFSETLTRARFEQLNLDLFRRTLPPIDLALEHANVTKSGIDRIVLVGGSSRIPAVQALLREHFADSEIVMSAYPDELVALGAAKQGAILSGQLYNEGCCLCFDLIPLSLGVETAGGVMHRIVHRNTIVPTKKVLRLSTYQDNQTSVLIQVFEGQRALTKHNRLLGSFELSGIPPAPRGVPVIEVSFEIDFNGALQVSAVERASNRTTQSTIGYDREHYSEEELEQLVRDAEQHAEEDREVQTRLRAHNGLDSFLHVYHLVTTHGEVSVAAKDMLIVIDEPPVYLAADDDD